MHVRAIQHRGRGFCTSGGPAHAFGHGVHTRGDAVCAHGGAAAACGHGVLTTLTEIQLPGIV